MFREKQTSPQLGKPGLFAGSIFALVLVRLSHCSDRLAEEREEQVTQSIETASDLAARRMGRCHEDCAFLPYFGDENGGPDTSSLVCESICVLAIEPHPRLDFRQNAVKCGTGCVATLAAACGADGQRSSTPLRDDCNDSGRLRTCTSKCLDELIATGKAAELVPEQSGESQR